MFLLFGLGRRLLVLAIVLAIPLVGGELLVRKLIGDALTSAVRQHIGVAPSIGLGSSPVLLELIRGRVDHVTVSAKGARIGGLPPLALSATLHAVHLANLTSLQGAIGSLTVDARLGPAAVRDLLATPTCIDSLPASLRAALTASPRVLIFPGRVDVLPPAGRAVELRLRPVAERGAVAFRATGLDVGGAPASASELGQVRAQTDCTRSLRQLPFDLSLVSASADAGTLALGFAGTGATFSALG
jgi:hypothetical protein